MTTHTDHVDPATARKLAELGAFRDRELRVGDLVLHKDHYSPSIKTCLVFEICTATSELHIAEVSTLPNTFLAWIHADDCLFLPRLTDLLDELERVCSTEDGCEVPTLLSGDRFLKWQCSIFDRQRTRMGHSFGTTREEAAARCLISVLETRTKETATNA